MPTDGENGASDDQRGSPQLTTPTAAPVSDPSPTSTTPPVAPVDDVRAEQGVNLSKILLVILSGSIVILVAYLWNLDSRTTDKVDQLYVNAFASLEEHGSSALLSRLDRAANLLGKLRSSPNNSLPPDDAKQLKADLSGIAGVFHPGKDELATFAACESIGVGEAREAGDEKASPSDETLKSKQQTEACIKFLGVFKSAAESPIDAERLRLMRDFAKDMQENHQGLRTFWLQATQLILVNVLLPLLTALLGYIFGRQASS